MTRRKSPHDLDTFHAHLDALKLFFIREHYPDVVRRAAEEQSDHLTVLERLIEGEANLRRDRSIERRIRLARFPVKKTLDSFDWSWPNKINRLQVQNLFRLRFLDDDANVVLVGGVGLGKSHLVTALGLQACERGYSVLFTSAIDAINISPPPRPPDSSNATCDATSDRDCSSSTNSAISPSTKPAPTCCSRSSANDTNAAQLRSPPIACSSTGPRSSTTMRL